MRRVTVALLGVFGMLGLSGSAMAQAVAMVRGVVTNSATSQPMPGVRVVDSDGIERATTGADGKFSFATAAGTPIVVRVQGVGFEPIQRRIDPVVADTVVHRFAIVALAQELRAAEVIGEKPVTGRLSEFEDRRKLGQGRFITDSTLTKNANRSLSEIVATMPGLRVARGMSNSAWITGTRGQGSTRNGGAISPSPQDQTRGARKACYATVMLDGIYVYSGRDSEPLFDVNSLGTATIAAIEYYAGASTVPLKFRGADTGCGLLIIWTR